MLGVEDMRLVRKFPVCEFTFGYSRVESGPRVSRDKTGTKWEMPVRLNLFPRVHFHEEHVQPIYVMKQDNEAFYVRLDESCVRAWLDANGIGYDTPAPNSRLGAAIIDAYDTINPEGGGFSSWLDEYRGSTAADSRNLYSYVCICSDTMAHQMMHAVAQVSGLELGGLTEHIFLPDPAFVVYRRGTAMDLGFLAPPGGWRPIRPTAASGALVDVGSDEPTVRFGSPVRRTRRCLPGLHPDPGGVLHHPEQPPEPFRAARYGETALGRSHPARSEHRRLLRRRKTNAPDGRAARCRRVTVNPRPNRII